MNESNKPRRKNIVSRAHWLVDTSVDDMQSGLSHYVSLQDLRVLEYGLQICKRRGEKTKMQILERKIRRLQEELESS